MTVTHAPRVSSGSITQFQAIRNFSGTVVGASTNLNSIMFDGLALSSGTNGNTVYIIENGTIDPNVFNLGDGYACAIGVNSSGIPIRATDSSCVSVLNYLGYCDGYGTITISPRQANNFNALDFGAIPNNTSSITRQINTNAHIVIQGILPNSTGAIEFWPTGNWYFAADPRDDSAAIHLTKPVRLLGSGGAHFLAGTDFYIPDTVTGIKTWHGNMASPVGISGYAAGCVIENIIFHGEGTSSIDAYGLDMRTPTHVTNCQFINFGGHGINISSLDNGFPDNWRVDWTRSTQCLDGIHVQGADVNNGACYSGDFQSNRGWAVYDASFLGCGWYECHAADNMVGPYYVKPVGISSLVNCYSESDQAPSQVSNTFVVGGDHGASFTGDSSYAGGLAYNEQFASGHLSYPDATLTAAGTNPPTTRIAITTPTTNLPVSNIIINVTTDGYPGGYDSFSNPQTTLVVEYSLDGGGTYTTGAMPSRGDDVYFMGPARLVLGSSGLTVYFSPLYYALDNTFTGRCSGGLISQFYAGTFDGTCSVMSWGHIAGINQTDPLADSQVWRLTYNNSTGRWIQTWANAISSKELAGSRSLPSAGYELHNPALWLGNESVGFNRIGYYDAGYSIGSGSFVSSTQNIPQWYSVGDILINRNQSGTNYPVGIRSNKYGGYSYTAGYGYNTLWSSGLSIRTGDTIKSSTPNGYIFRSQYTGATGSVEPTWPLSLNATVADGAISWINVGIEDGYNDGYVFEPVLVASPTLGIKDCTAGGTITLTFDEISHERYKLTGSPSGDFTVVIGVGAGDSWDRSVWNTTGHNATIKATVGDTGIVIPTVTAYRIFSDGTNTIRVT